jgi:hypothetical protein
MMTEKSESAQDRRAWEFLGAQDVQIVIQPIHMHTISGLRVKIVSIEVGGTNPELVGTVFTSVNKVEMRWNMKGAVRGPAGSEFDLREEYADLLGVLKSVASRFYPG